MDSCRAPGITIQRYMLNTLIHAQRCKIHHPYLTRSTIEPAYAQSRVSCLAAARVIIQTVLQLEKERLPFVFTRLKLSGIIYGLFMAVIVPLLDLCLNREAGRQEAQQVELAEAFRILEDARSQSVTAARVLEYLMDLLRKHMISPPTLSSQTELGSRTGHVSRMTRQEESVPTINSAGMERSTDNNFQALEGLPNDQGSSSYFDEISQSFDGGVDFEAFNWDHIFSGLDSSFI